MANRIVGNTYILDTSSANVALPWNSGSRIKAINVWFADSSGVVQLSGSNTSNFVFHAVHPANNNADQSFNYVLNGATFDEMKAPIITAGTAWVYFG